MKDPTDLIGQRFGSLTVTAVTWPEGVPAGLALVDAVCDCGEAREGVMFKRLRGGVTKACVTCSKAQQGKGLKQLHERRAEAEDEERPAPPQKAVRVFEPEDRPVERQPDVSPFTTILCRAGFL